MNDRLHYFNELTDAAKTLVAESSKELDSQKDFQRALQDTQKALSEAKGTFELLKELAEL